ncbi:MAG: hypothetical protein WD960_11615 [Gemmatimonadota bacterium]
MEGIVRIIPFLLALTVLLGCGEADPGFDGQGRQTPTEVETRLDRACGAKCDVLETALEWLLHETGVGPSDVLLEREGIADWLNASNIEEILTDLAAVHGVIVGSRHHAVDCIDERLLRTPPEPRCRLYGGKVIVRITPRSGDEEHEVLYVSYIEEAKEQNPISGVYGSTYELVLVPKGDGWIVRTAELRAIS